MSDQRYYDVVAEELQCKYIRTGLWARAVAETGGEGDTARSLYIRLRVSELIQIEQADRLRAAAEMERRVAEDAMWSDKLKEFEQAAAEVQRRVAEQAQGRDEQLARQEEERRRELEEVAKRYRIRTERAANHYPALIFVGFVIIVFILVLVSRIIVFR